MSEDKISKGTEYRVSPKDFSVRHNVKFSSLKEARSYVVANYSNSKVNWTDSKRLTIFAVTTFYSKKDWIREEEVKMPLLGFYWQMERFDNQLTVEQAMDAYIYEELEEKLLESCKQRLVEVENQGYLRKWELVVLRDAEVAPNSSEFKKYVDRLVEEYEAPRRAQTFVCDSLEECRKKCVLANTDVFTITYEVDGENISLPASWLDAYMFPDLFRYKGVPAGKHLSAKVWDEKNLIGYSYKVVQKSNNFIHHPYRWIYGDPAMDYKYALERMVSLTRY